jgi:hypothetical protein
MTEPISFETDVKPLFRERDQRSMNRMFDLWDYEDVKAHAAAILEQVRAGSMPCDEPWPSENVEKFQRWTESGFPA